MKSILLVFDIDETLLQMCGGNNYKDWLETPLNYKKTLNEACGGYILDFPKDKTVYIFRPYLKKLLNLIKKSNGLIKMALWTYGSRRHSQNTATAISKIFGFNDIIFTYGSEDITDNKYPKSLSQLWEDPKFKGVYSCENTFLVDNLITNICHTINKFNGILIQPFEPYGPSRQIFNPINFKTAIKDKVNLQLIILVKKILSNVLNQKELNRYNENTFPYCFNPFIHKNLRKYVKSYSNCDLITVGNIINEDINTEWSEYLWNSSSKNIKRTTPRNIENSYSIYDGKNKTKKNKPIRQNKKRSIKKRH